MEPKSSKYTQPLRLCRTHISNNRSYTGFVIASRWGIVQWCSSITLWDVLCICHTGWWLCWLNRSRESEPPVLLLWRRSPPERERETGWALSGLWWRDGWHVNCLVDVEGLRHTGLMLARAITKVVLICDYCVMYCVLESKNSCLENMIVLDTLNQLTLLWCNTHRNFNTSMHQLN